MADGMRHMHLFGALGVGLGLAVVVGHQTASAPALPDAVRAHVKEERFAIVTSIRGLPLGVREALQTLFGSGSLDIAEPDAEFQGSKPAARATLPSRRLVAAGCSTDHCLVYYEQGGATRGWRAALFHWVPAQTRFEGGGAAPGGLATVDAVRNAFLSGEIKDPGKSW
jgi:hypothetical protein